jgi:hypothetical protein
LVFFEIAMGNGLATLGKKLSTSLQLQFGFYLTHSLEEDITGVFAVN